MGRPVASSENKLVAVCFAKAVLKPSDARMDLVARSGPYSVYQALSQIFPGCSHSKANEGINEVQMNKALQKAGFMRVRDRRTHATKRADDPTGAGMYLFCNVRWRDPNDPDDRAELVKGWQALEKLPDLVQQCTFENFISVIERFHRNWLPSAERTGFTVEEVESEEDSIGMEVSPVHNFDFGKCCSAPNLLQSHRSVPSSGPTNGVFAPQATSPQWSMGQHLQPSSHDLTQEIMRLQAELAKAKAAPNMPCQATFPLGLSPGISTHSSLRPSYPLGSNAMNTSPIPFGAGGSLDLVSLVYGPKAPQPTVTPTRDISMMPVCVDSIKSSFGSQSPLSVLREGTALTAFPDAELRRTLSSSLLNLNLNIRC
eukprot:CAMPEP_0181329710 /NCGR_PEP_ID=MMETSP1101-20121128/23467_1 /TAXON_ID=46948 /ORGANISM="Rhodomonas abbreviata, Strain Caron Lab Isolate" /LENGTH=370 /DNA_ID=CAMNT_0023438829 /DNA_START=77 /DNA_END=1189 /DNA_ORIENTATION=-